LSDIFEEVEEEYRRERLVSGIRKGWPWALGALVLALGGIGFAQWYGDHTLQQRRAFSDRFIEAQELVKEAKWAEAQTRLTELLKEAPQAYLAPLHFERAAAFLGQNKPEDALAALESAAATAKTALLRDLARLQGGYIAADLPGTRAELAAKLDPLIKEGGGMGLLAREILALEDIEAGDAAAARQAFDYINLQIEAPPNLRQRAQTWLAVLPAPQTPPSAEPAADTASEPAGAALATSGSATP